MSGSLESLEDAQGRGAIGWKAHRSEKQEPWVGV